MEDRLNVGTQIWADGYSFMEVTETLMMALGIRAASANTAKPEADRAEPAEATTGDWIPGAEV
jgi:hypothetical protein